MPSPPSVRRARALLVARSLIGNSPTRPRHPHRPRQRGHRRIARRAHLRRRGQQHRRQHRGTRQGLAEPRTARGNGRVRRSAPLGAYGRMAEASPGKRLGHGALGNGRPRTRNGRFRCSRTGSRGNSSRSSTPHGRQTLANKPASGTAIIDELGPEHMRTANRCTRRRQRVQIAAHEDVIPVPDYRMCEVAYDLAAARAWE